MDIFSFYTPEYYFSAGGAIGGMIVVLAIFYLFAIGLAILFYVFQSLGLMGMLKKCGYDKPWLAWVPVANTYALGQLAEKYDDGKPAKKIGKTLLILYIVSMAMMIPFYIAEVMLILCINTSTSNVVIGTLAICMIAIGLAFLTLLIVYTVKLYMAIWRIFRIFSPDNATIFILLCIFISGAQPFIFFALRNNAPQNLRQAEFTPPQDTQYYEI